MNSLKLRNYQRIAVDKIYKAFKENDRVVLQVPTGGGKTVMASHILSNIGYNERAMFVVYGRQLVYQASRTLTANGIEHGIIMADQPLDLSYDIQVASIDTLRSRYFSLGKAPPFDLVIIDETHEIGRYSSIFEHYKKILGLSATPAMSNGGGLGEYYDTIVYGPPIKFLVKSGWLCPVRCYAPIIPDLSRLRISKQTNDYIESDLDDFMAKDEIVGDMFTHWAKIAYGKLTIVFASGVKHSKLSMQKFSEMGVPSAHVDGTTPQEEREEIFEAMRRGEILVLFNNRVFNRGMDFPPLECMIDAQPTLDMRLFIQKAGRIMRTSPGKESATLIDMTGSLHRWDKPDNPIIWPIEAKEKAEFLKKKKPPKEQKEAIQIPCPNCSHLINPARRQCPECGYELKSGEAEIKVKQIEGILGLFEGKKKEVKKVEPSMEQKRNVYRELMAYGDRVGYKPGWAKHKYKKIFGVWPRFPGYHLKNMKPANDVSAETLDWIQQDRQQFFKGE